MNYITFISYLWPSFGDNYFLVKIYFDISPFNDQNSGEGFFLKMA